MPTFRRPKIREHDILLYGGLLACVLLLAFVGGQGESVF